MASATSGELPEVEASCPCCHLAAWVCGHMLVHASSDTQASQEESPGAEGSRPGGRVGALLLHLIDTCLGNCIYCLLAIWLEYLITV